VVDSLVALTAWCISLERIERVFCNARTAVPQLVSKIVSEVEQCCHTRLVDRWRLWENSSQCYRGRDLGANL
jgi:hypothetical protein